MDRDERIRRLEKVAETFDRKAENADKNSDFQRLRWNGSGYRESAQRARESAEKTRRER